MDDTTYTFIQHQREIKSLVHSARIQRKGIRPRKVTLPSDSLTYKERKELNGKVMNYDFNKPYQHHQLYFWPQDLQREYLQRVIDTFNPPLISVQKDLLHVAWETAKKYIEDLGVVTKASHQTKEQKELYALFLGGKLNELKREKAPEPEPEKPKPEPKPKAESSLVIAYPKALSVSMEGLPLPIMETVARFMLDPKREYLIHITAEQKGEPYERHAEETEGDREVSD